MRSSLKWHLEKLQFLALPFSALVWFQLPHGASRGDFTLKLNYHNRQTGDLSFPLLQLGQAPSHYH